MYLSSAFKLSAISLSGILVLLTFSGSKHILPKVQAHEANEGCSVATVRGDYSLVLKGEVLGVGPIVSVGVSAFDGKRSLRRGSDGQCQRQCQSSSLNRNLYGESQLDRRL